MGLGINKIKFRIVSIRAFNLKFDKLISSKVGINHDLLPLIAECFECRTVRNSSRAILYLDLIRGLSIGVFRLRAEARTSPSRTPPTRTPPPAMRARRG